MSTDDDKYMTMEEFFQYLPFSEKSTEYLRRIDSETMDCTVFDMDYNMFVKKKNIRNDHLFLFYELKPKLMAACARDKTVSRAINAIDDPMMRFLFSVRKKNGKYEINSFILYRLTTLSEIEQNHPLIKRFFINKNKRSNHLVAERNFNKKGVTQAIFIKVMCSMKNKERIGTQMLDLLSKQYPKAALALNAVHSAFGFYLNSGFLRTNDLLTIYKPYRNMSKDDFYKKDNAMHYNKRNYTLKYFINEEEGYLMMRPPLYQ